MLKPARSTLTLALVCGVAACAAPHAEIAPEPIPPSAYEGANCRELTLMRAKTMRTLVFSSLAQDHNYAEDRTRVFGAPVPMATIFEESRTAEVARLKGEALALAAQLERIGCVVREG